MKRRILLKCRRLILPRERSGAGYGSCTDIRRAVHSSAPSEVDMSKKVYSIEAWFEKKAAAERFCQLHPGCQFSPARNNKGFIVFRFIKYGQHGDMIP